MAYNSKDNRNNVVGLSDDEATLIINICEEYEREVEDWRDAKIPLWLKLENYFNGLQRRFWDKMSKEWKPLNGDSESNRHYDKVINIYRAHAEAIIAALSVKIPSADFYPEDADVDEDVTTAKACIKIKNIVERHNDAKLLFIKAIAIMFNQGSVAAYIYNRKSKEYGTYQKPKYGGVIQRTTVLLNCPDCGNNMDEVVFKSEQDVYEVDDNELNCKVCGYKGIPKIEQYTEELPNLLGFTSEAKSRTKIEIFSPLFVHLPPYARNQELMPFLKLEFEQHFALLQEIYPKLNKKSKIRPQTNVDSEDRGIPVDHSNNLVTVKCWWVRPWGYNVVDCSYDRMEVLKEIKKKYPDGFYAVLIDDQLADIHNESLDDHWSVLENPLSTYIHGEPLGKPLAPIQDLENEVIDLQIETFEHAIPETFADAKVLDFKAYGKSRSQPGMIYPVNMTEERRTVGESFFTIKTATMSEEAELFLRKLDDKGQFVVGSFPSIYGGPATSGSKTAREYTESRAMALQRLSTTWNMMKSWWAKTSGKAVMQFIHAMRQDGQDYKDVEKTQTGFLTNWIRQSDIEGNIGRVESDANEDLPLTPAQMKDTFIQLLTLKDSELSEALYHPENSPLVARALGVPDFWIPHQDDRDKQYEEFQDLLNGVEIEVKPWEHHAIEAEVCKAFLISETGRIIKRVNPQGWATIETHMIAHNNAMMQGNVEGTVEEGKTGMPPTSPEGKPNGQAGAPIIGNNPTNRPAPAAVKRAEGAIENVQ